MALATPKSAPPSEWTCETTPGPEAFTASGQIGGPPRPARRLIDYGVLRGVDIRAFCAAGSAPFGRTGQTRKSARVGMAITPARRWDWCEAMGSPGCSACPPAARCVATFPRSRPAPPLHRRSLPGHARAPLQGVLRQRQHPEPGEAHRRPGRGRRPGHRHPLRPHQPAPRLRTLTPPRPHGLVGQARRWAHITAAESPGRELRPEERLWWYLADPIEEQPRLCAEVHRTLAALTGASDNPALRRLLDDLAQASSGRAGQLG